MGLYDSIIFVGTGDAPRCPDGHTVRDLQTKQMGNQMVDYFVWEGTLYRPESDGNGIWATSREVARYVLEGDHLVVTYEMRAQSVPAGVVVAYGTCETCLPVLVEASSGNGGWITEINPWLEFALCFEGPRLREWRPHKVESRDDIRKKSNAIADDDLVARRFFERWRRTPTRRAEASRAASEADVAASPRDGTAI